MIDPWVWTDWDSTQAYFCGLTLVPTSLSFSVRCLTPCKDVSWKNVDQSSVVFEPCFWALVIAVKELFHARWQFLTTSDIRTQKAGFWAAANQQRSRTPRLALGSDGTEGPLTSEKNRLISGIVFLHRWVQKFLHVPELLFCHFDFVCHQHGCRTSQTCFVGKALGTDDRGNGRKRIILHHLQQWQQIQNWRTNHMVWRSWSEGCNGAKILKRIQP